MICLNISPHFTKYRINYKKSYHPTYYVIVDVTTGCICWLFVSKALSFNHRPKLRHVSINTEVILDHNLT